MSEVDLEVVIVSYGAAHLLRRCLASLLEAAPRAATMRVHVVDNASRDGTPEMVAREFPTVRLHRLALNAGFSAANNTVLRHASARYVLLLNPDTEMRPGTLDHLVAVMDARPEVGVAGCRLERLDGTFDHAAKRSFPTLVGAVAHFTGIGRLARPRMLSQYRATGLGERGVGAVDAVNGAFMLVRRRAIDDVGLLDEGYWLYMEDLDWCARFWQQGWTVLYDGTVSAVHVKGGSAGVRRAFRQNLHFHRGMGRFYRRHRGGRNPILDLAVYAAIGVKLAVAAGRGWLSRTPR